MKIFFLFAHLIHFLCGQSTVHFLRDSYSVKRIYIVAEIEVLTFKGTKSVFKGCKIAYETFLNLQNKGVFVLSFKNKQIHVDPFVI